MEQRHEISDLLREAARYQSALNEMQAFDTIHAFDRVTKNIHRRRLRRYWGQAFRRVAAVMIIPLLLTTVAFMILYFHPTDAAYPTAFIETYSPANANTKIVLADSTVVWLHSRSKLRYPARFGKDREVELNGEGFFSVHSDPQHPFCVRLSNGIRVMACGTRFNISSYAQDSLIETTLEKGVVRIFKDHHVLSQLAPGEQAVYDKGKGSFRCSKVNVEEYISWKEDRMIFKNTPIDQALLQIARKYDVRMTVCHSSNRRYRIRATFDNNGLESTLQDIRLIVPIEWRQGTKDPATGQQTLFVNIR